MKKAMKILLAIFLTVGLIVVAVIIINHIMGMRYEARINAIRQDFRQTQPLYDDCVALAQRINVDQDFSIYYDKDLGRTVVVFDSYPLDVDPPLLTELNAKFKTMKYFSGGLDVWKGAQSMRLSESQLDGLGSYRQIDLAYYENPPSKVRGERLSEHWFLQQWYME